MVLLINKHKLSLNSAMTFWQSQYGNIKFDRAKRKRLLKTPFGQAWPS